MEACGDGRWALGAAALLKAVWWDFRLADGLVFLLSLRVVDCAGFSLQVVAVVVSYRIVCVCVGRRAGEGPVPTRCRLGHEELVPRRGRANAARLPDTDHPLPARRNQAPQPERYAPTDRQTHSQTHSDVTTASNSANSAFHPQRDGR